MFHRNKLDNSRINCQVSFLSVRGRKKNEREIPSVYLCASATPFTMPRNFAVIADDTRHKGLIKANSVQPCGTSVRYVTAYNGVINFPRRVFITFACYPLRICLRSLSLTLSLHRRQGSAIAVHSSGVENPTLQTRATSGYSLRFLRAHERTVVERNRD